MTVCWLVCVKNYYDNSDVQLRCQASSYSYYFQELGSGCLERQHRFTTKDRDMLRYMCADGSIK